MGSANLPQPIHAVTGVKLNGILSYFNSFNKKITFNKFQKPLLIKFDCATQRFQKHSEPQVTIQRTPTSLNPVSGKPILIHSSKLL
jgi:hypothetical protein